MKKIFYWIFYSFCGWTMALSLASSTVNAQCIGFWCDNYVPGITVIWTEKKQDAALLDTVKVTINWLLWILATVALVICLYAWFKMLTSWSDSKGYDAGLKTLKNAAIWLVIIWLSWLIVSAIFWFINSATNGAWIQDNNNSSNTSETRLE